MNDAIFTEITFAFAPDPNLYMLEPLTRAIYRFNPRADTLGREMLRGGSEDKIFSDAFKEVKKHISQGHHVVFASGSSNYIAEQVGRYFGAHKTIGTKAVVQSGKSTNMIEGYLCYGEGKLHLVEDHLRSIGLDLSEAYFYSDGIADLPLLERVRHRVAVNPSIELEKIATERGWPVLRWQDYLKGK
jgi:phosphoserine phosphatase